MRKQGWGLLFLLTISYNLAITDFVQEEDLAFPEDETALSRSRRQNEAPYRIGALLDSKDYSVEKTLIAGIQMANVLFASKSKPNVPLLKPHIIWIKKDELFKAASYACNLVNDGVVALVSPPDLLLRQSIKMISTQFEIPMIEVDWNTDKSNARRTINVHPDRDSFGHAAYEYVTNYEKWTNMVVILSQYEDITIFSNLLNNFEGTLVIRTWGSDPMKWKEIVSQLANNKEKNFLLDIPYWRAKEFLVLAYVHNMTGEQYHYLFTNWDTHLLDLTSFKIGNGARISTFSIVPNIAVDDRYRRGSIVEHLRGTIHNIERAQRSSEILPFLPAPVALTLDAIMVFGAGLAGKKQQIEISKNLVNCELPDAKWHYGELLVNASKAPRTRNISFLTGNVNFDKTGVRSDFNMSILSLQETGFIPIGYWNKREKLKITNFIDHEQRKAKVPMTTVTLRVTTMPDSPFMIPLAFDAYGHPLKTPDAWEGYCVDLLNEISKDVGFNYTIQIVKDRKYGSFVEMRNGVMIYNGMINEIINQEADMAVAALTVTYDREQVLDFTTPFMTLGLSLLFTRPKAQKPSIFSFLQPLSPTVWAYVITTYIVVSLGLFLVARLSPYEWQNPHPCESFSEEKENQFTILSSFFFFVSPLLNQGTEMAPHTISTRLLTGIWWFFALIIISTYTANLAAFFTVDTTKPLFESVEELAAQSKIKYGTLASGASVDFFKNSKIPVFQKMWQFMSKHNTLVKNTVEGIDRVLQGDYVFVLESSWNNFYNQRNCRLMQLGRLLDSKGYGIGLAQGSPYRDRISESILKLQKMQILDALERKWWNEYNISEPCMNMKDASKEASPLDIEQVGGVFVLLVIGFVWAFIVSVVEFCVHNRACMKSQGSLLSDMWKELKFAMRCMTPSTRTKLSAQPHPVIHSPVIDGEVAAEITAAAISILPEPSHLMCPASENHCHLLVPPAEDIRMNTRRNNPENSAAQSSSPSSSVTDQGSINEAYRPEGVGEGLSALSAQSIPWGVEQNTWDDVGNFQSQPFLDKNSRRFNKSNFVRD